jgi:hypothetical protein
MIKALDKLAKLDAGVPSSSFNCTALVGLRLSLLLSATATATATATASAQ